MDGFRVGFPISRVADSGKATTSELDAGTFAVSAGKHDAFQSCSSCGLNPAQVSSTRLRALTIFKHSMSLRHRSRKTFPAWIL